ncbi:Ulp1 protease family, carboxy-terminal domain protein [Sesbania bispinosa]|nr:Ulp1 protease family, carboxy-terminal domain protein [Sesbania bispinosa]
MREKKLNPPNNIAAEMAALLNRHSETNLIMSKLHEDYHTKVESAPCVIGSSHKIETDKATTGCADIPETKIPKWMPILFRPPSTMTLSDTEAEIASYIFMGSDILSSKENLVISLDGLAIGDRQTLMTFRPTSYVCTEVIMMVVCLLTHYKTLLCDYASCWFLPPHFSERALNEKNSTAEISKDYRYPFMGFVDKIKKIFIPIYDEGLHWTTECPAISEFPLILPKGLSKNFTSYPSCKVDDGMHLTYNYQSIAVNGESRMRLALDLVLDRHNQIRKIVVQNAYEKIKLFK